jgi:hypothetical protein
MGINTHIQNGVYITAHQVWKKNSFVIGKNLF